MAHRPLSEGSVGHRLKERSYCSALDVQLDSYEVQSKIVFEDPGVQLQRVSVYRREKFSRILKPSL